MDVNGIFAKIQNYNKMNDVSFQTPIRSLDIVGLLETHCDSDDLITMDGFECLQINRTKKAKARKASGGIAILIIKPPHPTSN